MPVTPIECIMNLSGLLQNKISGFGGFAGFVAEEKTGSGPILVWIILFAILILNSAWLFFLTKKGLYYRDRIRRHDKEINTVSIQSAKNSAADSRDIQKIKEDIISLGGDLESLSRRIYELSEPSGGDNEFNGTTTQSEAQTAGSVFFLGTPPAEKILKKQLFTRTFIPGVTLFRFVIMDNDERSAEFRFAGDERSTRDALSSPYKFIEPICNIENPDAPGTRKIATIAAGSVEKAGEDWIIKQKATVRYE
jgi:hypothetical protein